MVASSSPPPSVQTLMNAKRRQPCAIKGALIQNHTIFAHARTAMNSPRTRSHVWVSVAAAVYSNCMRTSHKVSLHCTACIIHLCFMRHTTQILMNVSVAWTGASTTATMMREPTTAPAGWDFHSMRISMAAPVSEEADCNCGRTLMA